MRNAMLDVSTVHPLDTKKLLKHRVWVRLLLVLIEPLEEDCMLSRGVIVPTTKDKGRLWPKQAPVCIP